MNSIPEHDDQDDFGDTPPLYSSEFWFDAHCVPQYDRLVADGVVTRAEADEYRAMRLQMGMPMSVFTEVKEREYARAQVKSIQATHRAFQTCKRLQVGLLLRSGFVRLTGGVVLRTDDSKRGLFLWDAEVLSEAEFSLAPYAGKAGHAAAREYTRRALATKLAPALRRALDRAGAGAPVEPLQHAATVVLAALQAQLADAEEARYAAVSLAGAMPLSEEGVVAVVAVQRLLEAVDAVERLVIA